MTLAQVLRASICSVVLLSCASLHALETTCPVTDPETSKVKVPWSEVDHLEGDHIWYGTESLAVLMAPDGRWRGMGSDDNYRNKLWLWSKDWVLVDEPKPILKVNARELYNENLTSEAGSMTHGFGDYWEAMLTGLGFPAEGCWEITAEYREAELSFVVMVEDTADANRTTR